MDDALNMVDIAFVPWVLRKMVVEVESSGNEARAPAGSHEVRAPSSQQHLDTACSMLSARQTSRMYPRCPTSSYRRALASY